MREQTSGLGQPVTKRRTLVPPGEGTYYQHPQPREGDPQLSTLEEDESYYVTRPHTHGMRNELKQRGNERVLRQILVIFVASGQEDVDTG